MSLELTLVLNALPVVGFLVLLFTDVGDRLDRVWYGLSIVALNAVVATGLVIFSYTGSESMRPQASFWLYALAVFAAFGLSSAYRVRTDRRLKREFDAEMAKRMSKKEPR